MRNDILVLDTGGEEGFAGSGDERKDYRGVPSSVDDCNAQKGTWEREGGSVSEKTTVGRGNEPHQAKD